MAEFQFFLEVLVGGLLSGVMYSLVAIGFVLIYKTSGVLNFAQGAMVLFAALTFVSLVERGVPFCGGAGDHAWRPWSLIGIAHRAHGAAAAGQPAADHAVHGDARPVLHHRGRGAAALGHAGARARSRHRGHAVRGLRASSSASSTCSRPASPAAMVALLTVFFRYTRIGLAFRAVADDQFAALAVGLRLPRIWARSGRRPAWSRWSPACSGARGSGVQFSLSLIVLKALPVLVLGGFDSIPAPSSAA